MTIPSSWMTSRYNFAFPVEDGTLLYNASSGATLILSGRHSEQLATLLCSESSRNCESEAFPASTWSDLTRGSFVVEFSNDELQTIKMRYQRARVETPLVLTVTTTMDCNLGCYYCYEERSGHKLEEHNVPALVELAKNRLAATSNKSLHVDWYGGEPLLNVDYLEHASLALQSLCESLGSHYSASIISNGTVWPEEVESFIARHAIRQVQISFDGLREHHNRRRRYRAKEDAEGERSSFDRAAELVDKLVHVVRVDVRFNIDAKNQSDLLPFLAFARDREWFSSQFPAVIQPARLAAYSDHSSFMRSCELPLERFDELRAQVRDELKGLAVVEESEAPNGYPYPKTSVCAALASASAVLGADSKIYRCGLQVGESSRSVGTLHKRLTNDLLPIIDASGDSEWWERFDPTDAPQCSRCSFLPICWGGCPKKHLEGDEHAIAEQGKYWRNNLPRLVASHVGKTLLDDYTVPESLQFRVSALLIASV